jgi:hypothetical protein
LIIVPLPPAKGRSIGTDSLWLSFRGMPRKLSQGIKTGENSRPTNGEDTTPAHKGAIARRVAAAIGTEHHEVVLTEGHFVENLEVALDSLDQPTFDGLNAYYMSHAIRTARVHRGADGHGRRRALRRLHLLSRPASAAALVWARRLGAARLAGGRGHAGDGDGRPVCSEMWPGNTADVTTVVPVIERLRRRFAIARCAWSPTAA